MKSMVGGCCVCSDERGWDENPLVYCDGQGCNVAVHQACYGIVTVPSGPWFCRKCESQERSARVRCELCPSRDGALKKTDSSGWAHVVCALYIPEVRFGNVTTMEPILISLIPPERFNKTCYICDDKKEKASVGACMQCNKAGCRQNFHVTCAQYKGLLCEEAGNMMDNVKYCGYCEYHYGKLRKTSNMKIIPPFKPVPNSAGESPASSPEKNQKHSSTGADSSANNGGNSTNNVSVSSSHISPDIASKTSSTSKHSLKKPSTGPISGKSGSVPPTNNSGSSSTSSSTNPSPIPRIQSTNVFSSGAFSSNLSSSGRHSEDKAKGHGSVKPEEEVNVKGEREDGHSHHSHSHRNSSSSSSNKFSIKAKDYSSISMTDVVTSALDRPMSGGLDPPTPLPLSSSSHRVDKPPPPPDIKPHVTLTPIPMRSSDESKMDRSIKSPALTFPSSFAQASKLLTSPEMVAAQETKAKNEAELSERFDAATPTKRQRQNQPVENYDSETDSASETWPSRMEDESESQSGSQSRTETHMSLKERFLAGSRHSPARMMTPQQGQDIGHWENNSSRLPQVTLERMRFSGREGSPFNSKIYSAEYIPKRGPGRPVKRRSGTSRDEEGPDMKVPARSRGRRGGGSTGGYSRRDTKDNSGLNNSNGSIDDRESTFEDLPYESGSVGSASRGGRHSGVTRKVISSNSNSLPKRPNYEEGPTMTFAQLKAQSASGDKVPAHMFGNLLNPASSMAQKMVDSLSQEMETIAEVTENTVPQTPLVGISFPGKSNSTAVVSNGTTAAPSAAPPQTLEELLERQWEQGSQFLMEQAQHLDIAQLLSCLNQLKQDNRALEDHVASLIQRKEHLSAINARLSIPLGSSGSLVNLGPAYSNHGSGSHGTPPLGQQQVNNKNISSVTSHNGSAVPSPQLQQQIMQESVVHQSRIPTHPFPGTESVGHGHHSSHHGHPHRDRDRSHNSGQSQMYGFPSGHSHQHGHGQSSGLPVPVVVASHSSPSQQHAPNSHHSSMSRDSR